MKKILATGIALLSVVPTTFAQTTAEENLVLDSATAYGRIDNRDNPMNTPLGTVADQYNRSNSTTTNTTATGAVDVKNFTKNGSEMWKAFHCAFLTRGFEWGKPTSDFANKNICSGVVAEIATTPQLEVQRQLVRDYIARLSGGDVVKTENNSNTTSAVINSKSAEAYKNFVIEFANFKKKFTILDENNVESYIKGAAEIFAKTYALEFPNEYRQRHFIEILQKYYAIPNISRQKLEEMATKYNFPILVDWVNKTKNMSENEIAWMDFGMVHGEYKITAEEKIDSTLYISLYNYQGKELDKSNLDIKVTASSLSNTTIKAEKKTEDSRNFDIVGEKISPNELAAATISISQKSNSAFPMTTTFPIKFVKIVEVEEKTISPTDTNILLPNGFEWELKKDLIKEDTKVKIIAKINGDFINYSVVYANDLNKKVALEGESGTIVIKSIDSSAKDYWTGNYDIIDNYFILKYFFF